MRDGDLLVHQQMEKPMRSSSLQLEHIPELIHKIQLRLPVKEAARTSVLSKSWLHAWSTIPILLFTQAVQSLSKEEEREHLKVVDRTLKRYLHDHIPFISIFLKFDIENQDSASFAEDLIRPVATKNCLKTLSLKILVSNGSFTLPDEILSGKNLSLLRIHSRTSKIHSLFMTSHPLINCVSLRELDFSHLHITDEVLDNIFSTCTLLVKIKLLRCKGFKTIKVKNLRRLRDLEITTSNERNDTVLEINHVPNLCRFSCDLCLPANSNTLPVNAHSISLGSRVMRLWLGGVIVNNAFLVESKFLFLNCLTLDMEYWRLGSFEFTCNSLKRLSLMSCPGRLIDIHVKAPKLSFFRFNGSGMPTLSFPAAVISPLQQFKLKLCLHRQVDASFFLKMKNALGLSINCDIQIINMMKTVILPPDIDDLRRRSPSPAKNVNELSFKTTRDEGHSESSPFFDAFFSICHPKHVVSYQDLTFEDNNHFSRLMVREVLMEKKSSNGYWRDYLKDVEIRRHPDEKWETLTDSWRSFLDESSSECVWFKLNWLDQNNNNPVISG